MTTLFFNNLTCIDHALVDNNGNIVGGSYHCNVEVTGAITDDESVVVDFSAGKKQMKAIIDHADGKIGLDHKLWIIPGYSACMLKNTSDTHCEVETKNGTRIILPHTDVHVVNTNFDTSIKETVAQDIANILADKMPQYSFAVQLTQTAFTMTDDAILFRYTHGLKDSTSYGCKNIAHGHLSFFEVTRYGNDYRQDCEDCKTGRRLIQQSIESISGSMFIKRENILFEGDKWIEYGYNTQRGYMWVKIDKNRQPHVIIDTETTVEYLAQYFAKNMMSALLLAKVKEFRISEGLQKGVTYRIDSDPYVLF